MEKPERQVSTYFISCATKASKQICDVHGYDTVSLSTAHCFLQRFRLGVEDLEGQSSKMCTESWKSSQKTGI